MLQNNDAPSGHTPRMAARIFLAGVHHIEGVMETPMATTHLPVMLEDALAALTPQPGDSILDATFGRGGHSAAILESLGEKGALYALDRDPVAAASASQRFGSDPRFHFRQIPFAQMTDAAQEWGIAGTLDGILMDIGVSSPQLDDPMRGFSFMTDGPLDMRMDPSSGESVADYLAGVEEAELAKVLWEYGEERQSRRIAAAICRAREQAEIATTQDLVDVIRGAVGRGDPNKHPATRSFQALRIYINDELGQLDSALEQCIDLLRPGGRLVVISFHSLEDRRVKRFMKANSSASQVIRGMPFEVPGEPARLRYNGRTVRASEAEIERNPRARSAILRVAERV